MELSTVFVCAFRRVAVVMAHIQRTCYAQHLLLGKSLGRFCRWFVCLSVGCRARLKALFGGGCGSGFLTRINKNHLLGGAISSAGYPGAAIRSLLRRAGAAHSSASIVRRLPLPVSVCHLPLGVRVGRFAVIVLVIHAARQLCQHLGLAQLSTAQPQQHHDILRVGQSVAPAASGAGVALPGRKPRTQVQTKTVAAAAARVGGVLVTDGQLTAVLLCCHGRRLSQQSAHQPEQLLLGQRLQLVGRQRRLVVVRRHRVPPAALIVSVRAESVHVQPADVQRVTGETPTDPWRPVLGAQIGRGARRPAAAAQVRRGDAERGGRCREEAAAGRSHRAGPPRRPGVVLPLRPGPVLRKRQRVTVSTQLTSVL